MRLGIHRMMNATKYLMSWGYVRLTMMKITPPTKATPSKKIIALLIFGKYRMNIIGKEKMNVRKKPVKNLFILMILII